MRAWSSFLCLALALLCACAFVGAQRGNRLKSTDASDIDRGLKIYEKSCAVCHFATSPEKKIGPGMKGVMKKPKFSNGWRVNDENMRRWIVAGRSEERRVGKECRYRWARGS